jgi:hypothetical protein
MPLTGAGDGTIPEATTDPEGSRPLEELVTSGVLWAINEEMFWQYGAALALHVEDGKVCGWSLQPSPDGKKVTVPREVANEKWGRYLDTCHEMLGWEPGW